MHVMKALVCKGKNGFTLIELLVVLTIISTLALGILSVVYSARKEARDNVRMSDAEQLKLGVRLYKEANGFYPAYNAGARIGVGGAIDTDLREFLKGINNDPLSDPASITYSYWYYSNFTCGGTPRELIAVRSMEMDDNSNFTQVCPGVPAVIGEYVVLIN